MAMHQEIDLSDPAAWDDTELVDAYERAIGSYMAPARASRAWPPERLCLRSHQTRAPPLAFHGTAHVSDFFAARSSERAEVASPR